MIGVLHSLGLDSLEATTTAQRMCSMKTFRSRKVTALELYGRGSPIDLANNQFKYLKNDGLCDMDLRTLKPNVEAWNFAKREDRMLARKMIRGLKPMWAISSPLCTAFSSWNQLNCHLMDPKDVEARLEEGRVHIRLAMEICRYQLNMGRHFAHEHPLAAASWKEKEVVELAADDRVHVVRMDQCMYGLVTPGPNRQPTPALKPTTWMTSSAQMASRLSNRCGHQHAHEVLQGGKAAAAAFFLPEPIDYPTPAWHERYGRSREPHLSCIRLATSSGRG